MEQRSSKADKTHTRVKYAGAGLSIGAALGMIFGLLLFEELAWGSGIGAAAGLLIGAAIDAQERR